MREEEYVITYKKVGAIDGDHLLMWLNRIRDLYVEHGHVEFKIPLNAVISAIERDYFKLDGDQP